MINYKIAIKKFSVVNFRKFDKLVVDFKNASITSLAGRNATGKTSVLEAINIALSERNSKFTEVVESDFYSDAPIAFDVEFDSPFFFTFNNEIDGYTRLIPCFGFTKTIGRRKIKERGKFFSSEYKVDIDYKMQDFLPTQDYYEALKQKVAQSGIGDSYKLVRGFKIDANGVCSYRQQSKSENEFDEIPNGHIDSFKYNMFSRILYPQAFYFDNKRDRELLSQYNTAFSNMVTELNWRFKRRFTEEKNKDKKQELFGTYEQLHEQIHELDSSEMDLINPAITRVKDNFGIDLGEDLKTLSFNIYQPYTNSLFGKITEQNQCISAIDFGSGIAMLLALSLSISFAEESGAPIIVLIDEPELHLHSDLQKKLFRFLKESNFQTILSTHSHLLIDKEDFENNQLMEELDDGKVSIKSTVQIDVADLQFRLLGNSLDDLYIPEHILIVEGEHDKNLVKKCLSLLGYDSLAIQIICAGGKDGLLDKPEQYKEVIDEILRQGRWYSDAIKSVLKIIVDGDVVITKVDSWVTDYGFDRDKQIMHLNPEEQLCMEYYLPKSVVNKCVYQTKLNDGSWLRDKDFESVIKIILDDDKEGDKTSCLQQDDRVSKKRLNQFVISELTPEILNSEESRALKEIIGWISDDN